MVFFAQRRSQVSSKGTSFYVCGSLTCSVEDVRRAQAAYLVTFLVYNQSIYSIYGSSIVDAASGFLARRVWGNALISSRIPESTRLGMKHKAAMISSSSIVRPRPPSQDLRPDVEFEH